VKHFEAMKRLAALVLLLSAVALAKDHVYVPGKLLDISSSERIVDGNSLRNAVYIVQLDDIVYTLRGGHIYRHGSDESSIFTVGDPVKVSVEGNEMFVLKPDGKVMKTEIEKKERVTK
jgi:hypothetical protein